MGCSRNGILPYIGTQALFLRQQLPVRRMICLEPLEVINLVPLVVLGFFLLCQLQLQLV